MNKPATTLDCLVAKGGQLYSLPAVAMEVLDLTGNPQVDTRALKECIENDPALTSKLLRVVNSSLFGLSREVSDLNQALALLGTKPLKLLVLGFSLPAGLFAGVAGEILGRYWRHTLTKAVAGREISEALFEMPGDEAFIAGLLQDLGMLLLIQQLGEPYAKFLEKAADSGRDLAAMEIESMGFDHAQVSARLLGQWGLPEVLVDAVAWQPSLGPTADASPPERSTPERSTPERSTPERSTPERSLPKILPEILHLAELLARILADQQPEVLGELLEAGSRYAGLTKDRLEELVADLGSKVGQLAEVLSLQLPGGLDYRDLLVRAHAQLAAVAAETAEDLVRASQAPASEEAAVFAEIQVLADAVAAVSRQPAESHADNRQSAIGNRQSAAGNQQSALGNQPAAGRRQPSASGVQAGAVATADPGLLGRLEAAAAACRQSRCPLSLLLVRLEKDDELMITRGVEGFRLLRQFLGTACTGMEHPGTVGMPHGETGYAVVLPDCERVQAVGLGNQLIETVRRFASPAGAAASAAVSLSVGVATVTMPPKNFPAADLFSSAERCLYGSSASGGSVVKSIEIY